MADMGRPPATSPTVRQRQFVKNVMAGLTYADAAEASGYSRGYGKELAKQPLVATLLQKHMEKEGITDELLAQKLRDGLNAKTPPRRDGGQRYDDQFVRKQFLDMIFRLRGDYAPEKTENTQKSIQIIINDRFLKSMKDTGMLGREEVEILEAEIVNQDEALRTLDAAEEQG